MRFPAISICNLNSLRGYSLLSWNNANSNRTELYETVVDIRRRVLNSPSSNIHVIMRDLYRKAGHKLEDMLIGCRIGEEKCTDKDFSMRLTLDGLCYTTIAPISATTAHFLLDPEAHEYVIPNSGYVGFKVIFHDPLEPLFAPTNQAIYVAPRFRTVIHIRGTRQIVQENCVAPHTRRLCMIRCYQKQFGDLCHCAFDECTLEQLFDCNVLYDERNGNYWQPRCQCRESCVRDKYNAFSASQTLRSPLFSRLNSVVNAHSRSINRTRFILAQQLQQWAFLREANRTAFENLRSMSIVLSKISTTSISIVKLSDELMTHWRYLSDVLTHSSSNLCNRGRKFLDDFKTLVGATSMKIHNLSRSLRRSLLAPFHNTSSYINLHCHVVMLFYRFPSAGASELIIPTEDFNQLHADIAMLEVRHASLGQCKEPSASGTGSEILRRIGRLKLLLSDLKRKVTLFNRTVTETRRYSTSIRAVFPRNLAANDDTDYMRLVSVSMYLKQGQTVVMQKATITPRRTSIGTVIGIVLSGLSAGLVLTIIIEGRLHTRIIKHKTLNSVGHMKVINTTKKHRHFNQEKSQELLETMTVL